MRLVIINTQAQHLFDFFTEERGPWLVKYHLLFTPPTNLIVSVWGARCLPPTAFP